MKDEQIDKLFHAGPEMPAELAARVRARIQSDTRPARPLMSDFSHVGVFFGLVGLISIGFAALLRFKGLHALSGAAATELLLMLALAAFFSVYIAARSMRPASGPLRIWLLGGFALAAYEALILRLFSDYTTSGFIHSGLVCLSLGVLCGAMTGLPLWALVRRGFVVQPVRAGAAIGLISGLSGLTFLTLHCDNLTVPHDSIWHAGVLVLCMAAGALGSSRLTR